MHEAIKSSIITFDDDISDFVSLQCLPKVCGIADNACLRPMAVQRDDALLVVGEGCGCEPQGKQGPQREAYARPMDHIPGPSGSPVQNLKSTWLFSRITLRLLPSLRHYSSQVYSKPTNGVTSDPQTFQIVGPSSGDTADVSTCGLYCLALITELSALHTSICLYSRTGPASEDTRLRQATGGLHSLFQFRSIQGAILQTLMFALSR